MKDQNKLLDFVLDNISIYDIIERYSDLTIGSSQAGLDKLIVAVEDSYSVKIEEYL